MRRHQKGYQGKEPPDEAERVHLPAWEAENGARGMVAMEMIGWVPQRAKVVFKGEAYYLQKYVKAADEHNKKIPA